MLHIGIIKRALSKRLGQSLLTYPEFEDVLLDLGNCKNNPPFLYQKEEFEQPVLTPNTLLRLGGNQTQSWRKIFRELVKTK